jgi:leader peptidase (prepilin peptidase)/N-methyltransferase
MVDDLGLPVTVGFFGLLFGSFLNVCIHRLPEHRSVVSPRSYCPHCKQQIDWYDNIPLVSYMLLRGRCRSCRSRISWRYPLVELATAIFFGAAAQTFGLSAEAAKWLVFGSLMIALFWTDLETLLLPDSLTLSGTALGLLFALATPVNSGAGDWLFPNLPITARSELNSLSGALLLSLPLMLVAICYARLRRIEPMGLGDLKLLGLMGAFLGPALGLLALFLGSIAGSVIGLGYILGARKNPRREPLPFGSFLCGASIVVIFWGKPLLARWWGLGR